MTVTLQKTQPGPLFQVLGYLRDLIAEGLLDQDWANWMFRHVLEMPPEQQEQITQPGLRQWAQSLWVRAH